jgi:hypothetical protein
VSPHDWHERHPPFGECGKAVERPRAHEGLGKRHVLEKDLLDAMRLGRAPVKQRQGTNDLQPDFPLVARRERADEDLLVRRDPIHMCVRQFLQEIERALSDEPILVGGERRQFAHERRVVFDQEPNAIGRRNAAPIAAAEQQTDLTRTRGLHVAGQDSPVLQSHVSHGIDDRACRLHGIENG